VIVAAGIFFGDFFFSCCFLAGVFGFEVGAFGFGFEETLGFEGAFGFGFGETEALCARGLVGVFFAFFGTLVGLTSLRFGGTTFFAGRFAAGFLGSGSVSDSDCSVAENSSSEV
jgi:hypothetical protein